ncbi:MFS transporter [Methanofollis sp. UBA420]|jgi:EmrB/QacA subfamily drug resistance transporter|uniref:MFS transporter n=1 Tax=Methanofollis sp. UBA420 TaxID=1915514 RepID=UPI00316ABF3D
MTSVITVPLHQKLLLGAVALGTIMDGLDGSIVNVALPTIAADFDTDIGTIAWVIITYLLMMAGFLLVFGKIADRGLMKMIFISGFIIFTLASAACGLSPALPILLASRIVQGIGAAMIAAVAPLLCVRYLPPRMLGIALGVLTAANSIGFAAGPAIGGILTHYLSWHWIFLINIPIGIIGILFASRVIPTDHPIEDKTPFDFAGVATLFGAVVSGIFVLEEVAALGITDPLILVCATLCVLFASLFIIRELKTPTPLINIRVFGTWQFTSVLTAFLLINVVYMGVLYLLPFYLTAEMEFSMATSGMYLLIPPAITALLGITFGRLSDRYGRRGFVVAACLVIIVFNCIFATYVPEAGVVPLLFALVLMGAAFGIAGGPASSKIIECAPEGEEGTGSSLMITTVYLGGVLGTALYATIFTFITASDGLVSFTDLDSATFLAGFHVTISIGLILSVLSLVLSAIVRDDDRHAL